MPSLAELLRMSPNGSGDEGPMATSMPKEQGSGLSSLLREYGADKPVKPETASDEPSMAKQLGAHHSAMQPRKNGRFVAGK